MADSSPGRANVFISYSHQDEVWKDRLVKHLAPLRQEGLLEIWDDRRIAGGEEWRAEIERAIEQANVVVLLVSADYLTSGFIRGVEIPRLLERRAREGVRIIPVIVRDCLWMRVSWLSALQAWSTRPLSHLRGVQRDKSLAELARKIFELVRSDGPEAAQAASPRTGPRISISRLPATGGDLFGREAELKALDEAWEDPRVRTLSVIGWGGTGKTALVNRWLARMARDRYRGAERVFGWSFYGRKTAEGFLAEALEWFADAPPESTAPQRQAERLAALMLASRTLLVLDGLEVLQDGTGRLLSPALESLIRELSQGQRGLVILVSRIALPQRLSQRVLDLSSLSPEAGVALLRSVGVRGSDAELAAACRELGGHPLSLALAGNLLRETRDGDVRRLREVTDLGMAGSRGAAASRMLAEYERLLGEGADLSLLRLSGLSDRPVSRGELAALCDEPLAGLTDAPELRSEEGRSKALARLAGLGLLTLEPDGAVQVHSLIREHFRRRLREDRPDALRQGHERLFRFLSATAGSLPRSLEEMAPLMAAVAHGCAAGLRSEALKLYRDRIARGDEQYLTRTLGAYGAELSLLAGFFDAPWDRSGSDLAGSDADALLLLEAAAADLSAAGRTREALAPAAARLERARAAQRWDDAARAAARLSEVRLLLGNLDEALVSGQEAVELAERSGGEGTPEARIVLADALHQCGRPRDAERMLAGAEAPVYQRFDLLLSLGRFRVVLKQASSQRSQAESSGHLLQAALAQLALGRAHLEEDAERAQPYLDQAVDQLRRAGVRHRLAAGLTVRGAFLVRGERLEEAGRDLEEALEIATRSELRLQEADVWLAFARLHLAAGDPERARQSLSRARALVDQTGYHRRDGEILDLDGRLADVAPASPLDPVELAFRLVLAGQAAPDLLLHPDADEIEKAARRLAAEEPGDPLLQAQRTLRDDQAGIVPNPLWAAWITATQGTALQKLGQKPGKPPAA